MSLPEVKETKIPGLFKVGLILHGDKRGWFKENWQKEKLGRAGLPAFEPVQNNVSFNKQKGVTRGIHAEPWDKFISVAHGEVFAAIVDLRKGDNFGVAETFTLTPDDAIYVPRGCGNSFQTLTNDVVYTYLVNEYWRPDADYVAVHIKDPNLNIPWPIDPDSEEAIISEKDRANPFLESIKPMEV